MTDNEHAVSAGNGLNVAFPGGNPQGEADFALLTRRVNSFNARGCALVFATLAGVSLFIAVVFSAFGAWLILPFAGVETVALYAAYAWLLRHAGDCESLEIRGDVVALAVSEASDTRRHEFNRVWARLVETRSRGEVKLALRSHGREVEVGRYLDGGGRELLARELKQRLHAR